VPLTLRSPCLCYSSLSPGLQPQPHTGFSGAELANVVNESALLAARKDQDNVTLRDCLEGVRRTK